MQDSTDILIIGGGPGGLACAARLARHGARVMLVERKTRIGPKVCAGGVTGGGLLRHLTDSLIERQFSAQHLVTRAQHAVIKARRPIAATVSREALGQWMAEQAQEAGALLLPGWTCRKLEPGQAVLEAQDGTTKKIRFAHLVGADGSHSLVRRFLGLPVRAMGLGLNAMPPGQEERMQWHLLNDAGAGAGPAYGWIFPHREAVSTGIYSAFAGNSARLLKKKLLGFAARQGLHLEEAAIRAGWINFDYRGFRFGRVWLCGDAAGLASAVSGEGIYPALVSGRAVAARILQPQAPIPEMERLVRKWRLHHRAFTLARRVPVLGGFSAELLAALLRLRLLPFRALEMAS